MKIFLIYLFTIFIFIPRLFSQSNLYIPLNVEKAYEKNTRNYDGTPGVNYWQNRSDYKIKVNLNPVTKLLTGEESIIYINNSPDSLTQIIIRLYQNLNKPESPKDFQMDSKSINDGVKIKSMKIDGTIIDLNNPEISNIWGTNLVVQLKKPIRQKSTSGIEISWSFTVPPAPNPRMGAYDSSTFFIAYWYPQVAVYDDINGWDEINYSGLLEFYNDFNKYDIEITIPNNYCVWSTGVLQNPEEIYSLQILTRYNTAKNSDSIINIISKNDYLKKTSLFNNSKETNTWHFKADNVSDFAFAASDYYYWDATSMEVSSGKRVLISSVYNPKSKDFYEVDSIARVTIQKFSTEFPGVPYPYPTMTIFNGDEGMEFPMMVNEGSSEERVWSVNVTVHEIAHTYFPFYMGINERYYAWMDEGCAQMMSEYVQNTLAPEIDMRARNVFRYLNMAGNQNDVPMMNLSGNLSGTAYGNSSYFRPCVAYNILRDVTGKEVFDKAFREYINRWNGKHPIPYDFFYTIENATGLELDWFWKPWFFDYGYPDLAIDEVINQGLNIKVLITKIGELPIPINLNIFMAEGKTKNIYKSADVWKDGNDSLWIEENLEKPLVYLKLGDKYIPDADSTNNVWGLK